MHERGQVVFQQRGLLLERLLRFGHNVKGALLSDDGVVVHYSVGPNHLIFQKSKSSGSKKHNLDFFIHKLVYSNNLKLYIGSCADLHLRVFNQHFDLLQSIPLNTTILSLAYNEQTSELYAGEAGCLYCWKLQFQLNDFLIPGSSIKCKISKNEWIISLSVCALSNLVLAVCQTGIYIIDTKTHEQQNYITNPHMTSLTCPNQYIITAAKDGSIKILSSTLNTEIPSPELGHLQEVTALKIHPQLSQLISASLDGTIRFWDLQNFTMHHNYQFGFPLVMMTVAPNGDILTYSQQEVAVLKVNQVELALLAVNSTIHSVSTFGASKDLALVATEDGSVRIVSITSGTCITILFPMYSSPMLRDAAYSITEKILYTLLCTGEVMVFTASTNPCSAKQLWIPSSTGERVTCISMVQDNQHSVLLAGHQCGSISILFNRGYRITQPCPAHNGSITKLASSEEFSELSDKYMATIASFGEDGIIQVWNLCIRKNWREECFLKSLTSIYADCIPTCIAIRNGNLALATTGNQLLVFHIPKTDSSNTLLSRNYAFQPVTHIPEDAHTSKINSLDISQILDLIVTCGEDGRVKVWDMSCNLVSDINLGSPVTSVCFTKQDMVNILIGFRSQLCIIPAGKYLPSHYSNSQEFLHIVKEKPILFNPQLKFWFEPERVPTFFLWDNTRIDDLALIVTQCVKDSQQLSDLQTSRGSRYSVSDTCSQVKDITRCAVLSGVSVRNEAMIDKDLASSLSQQYYMSIKKENEQYQLHTALMQDAEAPSDGPPSPKLLTSDLSSCHSCSEVPSQTQTHSLIQMNSKFSISPIGNKKPALPLAPDGFIPNSVIRGCYKLKVPDPIPEIASRFIVEKSILTKKLNLNSEIDLEKVVLTAADREQDGSLSNIEGSKNTESRTTALPSSLDQEGNGGASATSLTDSMVESQTKPRTVSSFVTKPVKSVKKETEETIAVEPNIVQGNKTKRPVKASINTKGQKGSSSPGIYVSKKPQPPTLTSNKDAHSRGLLSYPSSPISSPTPLTLHLPTKSADENQRTKSPSLSESPLTSQVRAQERAISNSSPLSMSTMVPTGRETSKFHRISSATSGTESNFKHTCSMEILSNLPREPELRGIKENNDDSPSLQKPDISSEPLATIIQSKGTSIEVPTPAQFSERVDQSRLMKLLKTIISNPWFPRSKLGISIAESDELVVLQCVVKELMALLRSHELPVFGQVCDSLISLDELKCLSTSQKLEIVSLALMRMQTAASSILKSDALKLVARLNIKNHAILKAILPLLVDRNVRLRNAGFTALKELTGVTNRAGLHKLLVNMGLLQYVAINEDQVLNDLEERLRRQLEIQSSAQNLSPNQDGSGCSLSKSTRISHGDIRPSQSTPNKPSPPFFVQISQSSFNSSYRTDTRSSFPSKSSIRVKTLPDLIHFSQSKTAREILLKYYSRNDKTRGMLRKQHFEKYEWSNVHPFVCSRHFKDLRKVSQSNKKYVATLPKLK